jgi:protein-disulfide isomerase
MSSDESPNVPAKRDRREAVREKAQQVHVRQSRMRLLRGVLLGAAGLVVLGGAAAGVTWAVTANGPRPLVQPSDASNGGFAVTAVSGIASTTTDTSVEAATAAPQEVPVAPTPAAASAPVEVRVYVDYLSSAAREFQMANAQQLSRWVNQDAVSLTYYPVAMLTSKSNGTKYSLRAASAAACVATHSPDTFFKYNDELLREQPDVDSDGHTDEQLADLAQASGVTQVRDVRTCIENEDFASWARATTDRALEGIPDTNGLALDRTPMILVNGVPYVGATDDPREFAQFVLSSASDAYFGTPTPTPAASETPTPAP